MQVALQLASGVTLAALVYQAFSNPGFLPGSALVAAVASVLHLIFCTTASWCALDPQMCCNVSDTASPSYQHIFEVPAPFHSLLSHILYADEPRWHPQSACLSGGRFVCYHGCPCGAHAWAVSRPGDLGGCSRFGCPWSWCRSHGLLSCHALSIPCANHRCDTRAGCCLGLGAL